MTFEKLIAEIENSSVPPNYRQILIEFITEYKNAVLNFSENHIDLLKTFLEKVKEQFLSPYRFSLYHQKIRSPFDYYRFGIEFLSPLIDLFSSKLLGKEIFLEIRLNLKKKENAILLANHQTEGDPQAISILLEKDFPDIASKIIYVAGERVIKDPLAIPFSMGCDLLCIYSKKYLSLPPEKKLEKIRHNQKTLEKMRQLLSQGGKIIYLAPSGGRDRPDEEGTVQIAPFDPQSIELFYLLSKKSKKKTHFYPLALATYNLLPPPDTLQVEMGEKRRTKRSPVHLKLCPEWPFAPLAKDLRAKRAEEIWTAVKNAYHELLK